MWQYIAFYENGCYSVREYYTDLDRYTANPIEPCGETYEELIQDLENMLEDVKRGVNDE